MEQIKHTVKQLAKKYNISESGIRASIYSRNHYPYQKIGSTIYILEKDFLVYRNSKSRISIGKEEIQKWKNEYLDGKSFKQIGIDYKRSQETVSKYLKQDSELITTDYLRSFSTEEKSYYNNLYQIYKDSENLSITGLLKLYPVKSRNRLLSYFKRCGLKIKSLSEVNRIVKNENFFQNIDTEIKSYLLGFFAADGHIEKRKDYDSYTLRVGVQLNDYHILELYRKYIAPEVAIYCKKNMASIAITCKTIGTDLLKLGYDNRKTYTMKSLPNISSDMMPHFIRGYFDGDGSIILQARRVGKRLSGYNKEFNITGHKKIVLQQIGDLLKVAYKINVIAKKSMLIDTYLADFKESYSLSVNDTESLAVIYHYLYEDATYFFKRKRDKFMLSLLSADKIAAALQGDL